MKLVLSLGGDFKYGDDKSKTAYYFIDRTDPKKERRLACFDTGLKEHFDKAGVDGKPHDYTLKDSTRGGNPTVTGMAGYEKKKGGWGNRQYSAGPSGPMFTDRQVALLAASGDVAKAEAGLRWLSSKGDTPNRQNAAQSAKPQASVSPKEHTEPEPSKATESPAEPPARLAPVVDRGPLIEELRQLILAQVNGEATAARNWCIERWGDWFTSLEGVMTDDLVKARRDLAQAAKKRPARAG